MVKILRTPLTVHLRTAVTEICRVSLLRISIFVSLDVSILLHRRCLMLKLSEILILVCSKKKFLLFNRFCMKLFLIAVVSISYKNLIFSLLTKYFMIGNIFDLSNLLHSWWPFLFHQKFLISDLKNFLTEHFPKMQPFANVVQNRCYYKFLDIHRKYRCWSLFLIKLQNWWPATLLKRDPNAGVSLWISQNVWEKLC